MNESTPSPLAWAYQRGVSARLSGPGKSTNIPMVKVRLISRTL
jgi:hypothetical protein